MGKIANHHKKLAEDFKVYKQNGGEMSWNQYQRNSSPSPSDLRYVKLLEHIKSHTLKNRRSLESTYTKIKDLLDEYSTMAQEAYSTFVLSDYSDATTESQYKMCKLRINKLTNLLNIVFCTALEYETALTDKHAQIDKTMMVGVGKYYLDEETDEDIF